ncbi:MAG: CoA-binding protein [Proteobacteria bacterium]|nr:CoA-binding protein [Pseudomonadota bacterium]
MSILLDSTTRILVQGITGRQARTHVAYMRKYGSNVVAGVSPGKGGQEVDGLPVYDTVAAALARHAVDISVLFIPGPAVRDPALEAIEHGIPHVHVLAEGVPHHDTALIVERAEAKGVRLIGPNSQGMISPGKAKLGGTGGPEPDKVFRPGPVGIISRSGGMGVEIGNALTRRGVGQSTYVSIGGDLLIGTAFAPLLELFEKDPETKAVVMFGEAGTGHEEAAAGFIKAGGFTKPAVALVVGEAMERLPKGMSFGHTSSIIERGLGSPRRKKELLREAGVRVADTFAELAPLVEAALARAA